MVIICSVRTRGNIQLCDHLFLPGPDAVLGDTDPRLSLLVLLRETSFSCLVLSLNLLPERFLRFLFLIDPELVLFASFPFSHFLPSYRIYLFSMLRSLFRFLHHSLLLAQECSKFSGIRFSPMTAPVARASRVWSMLLLSTLRRLQCLQVGFMIQFPPFVPVSLVHVCHP